MGGAPHNIDRFGIPPPPPPPPPPPEREEMAREAKGVPRKTLTNIKPGEIHYLENPMERSLREYNEAVAENERAFQKDKRELLDRLLDTNMATTFDYSTVQSLMKGDVTTFMGFDLNDLIRIHKKYPEGSIFDACLEERKQIVSTYEDTKMCTRNIERVIEKQKKSKAVSKVQNGFANEYWDPDKGKGLISKIIGWFK